MLAAIGLLAFRAVIARPLLVSEEDERGLRGVSWAAAIALAVALVATPVYLVLATAEFSIRPWTELGAIIPLVRDSSFGRAFSDLWASAGDCWQSHRRWRSRSTGRAGPAARARRCWRCSARPAARQRRSPSPAWPGTPPRPAPSGVMLALDWAHLAAASIWIGGLIGLLVLAATTAAGERVAMLAVVVPRFSRAAIVSVALLLFTGVVASIVHLPTLGSLWETNYGLALIAKSILLVCALALAGVNNLRSRPRLVAAAQRRDRELGDSAARSLQRLVLGEVALLVGAVIAASILTSIAPPSSALAKLGKSDGRVGPGVVARTFTRDGVRVQVGIRPNRAAIDNAFGLRLTRAGKPVRNALITAQLDMLDMSMQQQAYTLPEVSPGVYERRKPRARDGRPLAARLHDRDPRAQADPPPGRRQGGGMR